MRRCANVDTRWSAWKDWATRGALSPPPPPAADDARQYAEWGRLPAQTRV